MMTKGYNAIYATGWYSSDMADVAARMGQYHLMVCEGLRMEWDTTESRYVVRD